MFLASQLLAHKGQSVETIEPQATVLEAARRMNARRIGALVVVNDQPRSNVVGIVTERDIMTRLVSAQRDPQRTTVAEIMTADVVTCSPATTLDDLRRIMRTRRIRHVPVVHDGQLVGMISIGDLNLAENEVLAETVQSLRDYIRQA